MNADIPLFPEHNIFIWKTREKFAWIARNYYQRAIIGKNYFISHQVTIGSSMNEVPIIGDNCYIGLGIKIFGNIRISNNVRIGANYPVFFDILDNGTVVFPKLRVI